MQGRITRRTAFALAGAIIAGLALPAYAGDEAVAFVKALYALPRKWGDVAGDAAARQKYLTPDFAAVVKENSKYSGDLDYAVDYDPLIQAQDWDQLKDMKFTVEKSSADAASVRVTFTNQDQAETVRFALARTAAGWRLADLFNSEGASLLQEYKNLNTAGRAVKAAN